MRFVITCRVCIVSPLVCRFCVNLNKNGPVFISLTLALHNDHDKNMHVQKCLNFLFCTQKISKRIFLLKSQHSVVLTIPTLLL